MVNNAIRFILNGEADCAIEELLQAIWKSDGYVHDDIVCQVNEAHKRIWKERKRGNTLSKDRGDAK
jgi:hypothetical protein